MDQFILLEAISDSNMHRSTSMSNIHFALQMGNIRFCCSQPKKKMKQWEKSSWKQSEERKHVLLRWRRKERITLMWGCEKDGLQYFHRESNTSQPDGEETEVGCKMCSMPPSPTASLNQSNSSRVTRNMDPFHGCKLHGVLYVTCVARINERNCNRMFRHGSVWPLRCHLISLYICWKKNKKYCHNSSGIIRLWMWKTFKRRQQLILISLFLALYGSSHNWK